MATATKTRKRVRKLDLDEALIALVIGAMNANDHVSPEEGARAHHLVWSTRRFRRRPGETVGRLIDRMRSLLEEHGTAAVMAVAARAVPARMRPPAFALVVDLLLADGKVDSRERTFLQHLASDLHIDPLTARQVVDVMLLKNRL